MKENMHFSRLVCSYLDTRRQERIITLSTGYKSFENIAKFCVLGMTVKIKNCILNKIQSRLKVGKFLIPISSESLYLSVFYLKI